MGENCKEHSGVCEKILSIEDKVKTMGDNFEKWCVEMKSWRENLQRWLIGILASSLVTSLFIIVQLSRTK
jgi:hypothetical protein